MNISRRNFLGVTALAGAGLALPGCCAFTGSKRYGKVALQLYSIGDYIKKNGLAKTLKEIKAIGYEGVEFAGYHGFDAKTLKKMLDDNGLVACGTHVSTSAFTPDKIKETIDFNLAYGNRYICCPGGGNMPPGCSWSKMSAPSSAAVDEFTKKLCEFYNRAAETAKGYGCLIGLHNHEWEFNIKMTDGTTFWDYFFSHTDPIVQMEQDVGWTTCAGFDPCEQYKKYPHRSFTLHAKENGMGKNVKKFDAILGQPGQPGAKGVDWDKLFPVTDADGVEWYVVECERHMGDLIAVKGSWEFLHAKGRC